MLSQVVLLLLACPYYFSYAMKRSAPSEPNQPQVVLRYNIPNVLNHVDVLLEQFRTAFIRPSPDYLLEMVSSPYNLEILEKTEAGKNCYEDLKAHPLDEVKFLVAIYEQDHLGIFYFMKTLPRESLLRHLVYMVESLEDWNFVLLCTEHAYFLTEILNEMAVNEDYRLGQIYKRIIKCGAFNFLDSLLSSSSLHLNPSLFFHVDVAENNSIFGYLLTHLKTFADSEEIEFKKRNILSAVFKQLIISKSLGFMKQMVVQWQEVFERCDCVFLRLLAEHSSHTLIKDLVLALAGNKTEKDYENESSEPWHYFYPMSGDVEALKVAFNANKIHELCWLQELVDGYSNVVFINWIFKALPLDRQKKYVDQVVAIPENMLSYSVNNELRRNLLRYGSVEILQYYLDMVEDFECFSIAFVDALGKMPVSNLKCFYDHRKFNTYYEDEDEKVPYISAGQLGRKDLLYAIAEHPNHDYDHYDIKKAAQKHDVELVRILLDRNCCDYSADKLSRSVEKRWLASRKPVTPEILEARRQIRELFNKYGSFVNNNEDVQDPIYGSFENAIQLALAFQTQEIHEIYFDILFNVLPELGSILGTKLKLDLIVRCLGRGANKDALLQFMRETMSNVKILHVLRLLVEYEGNEEFIQNITDRQLREKVKRIYY